MPDFAETPAQFDGVRQIEDNDQILGGAEEIGGAVNSPPNYALRALVRRTAWLRAQIAALSIPDASTTVRGLVELASTAEVAAGTDQTKAVTPHTLQEKIDALPAPPNVLNILRGADGQATETRRGTAEVATQTEAETGMDNTTMMTPLRAKQLFDELTS